MLKISLILGAVAALADIAGGLVLVRAHGVEKFLRYFVALGAGDDAREFQDEPSTGTRSGNGRILRRSSA